VQGLQWDIYSFILRCVAVSTLIAKELQCIPLSTMTCSPPVATSAYQSHSLCRQNAHARTPTQTILHTHNHTHTHTHTHTPNPTPTSTPTTSQPRTLLGERGTLHSEVRFTRAAQSRACASKSSSEPTNACVWVGLMARGPAAGCLADTERSALRAPCVWNCVPLELVSV
jgi:hypothetical protein